jgi:hypothetical protein
MTTFHDGSDVNGAMKQRLRLPLSSPCGLSLTLRRGARDRRS